MIANVKERLPFFKGKTLDEYNQTILMPSFNMMEMDNIAKLIGIDLNDYKLLVQNPKNKNYNDVNYRVMRLINYISKVSFDDDFINRITKKMIFVVNYGNFTCNSKSFAGTVLVNNNEYKFAIEIDSTSITYASEYLNSKLRGKFSVEPDGIKIKYNSNSKMNKTLNDCEEFDIKSEVIIKIFNKKGNQIFEHHKKQKYNYYKIDGDDKKIIKEINANQNYSKNEYIWKCPKNTIIKKIDIKYQYPKELCHNLKDVNEVLIGKNISPNSNTIPSRGKFYKLEYKDFIDYCSNKCDIDTLWESVGKYKYIK